MAVKAHHISQAGYGLSKKFFPRAQGEFRVIRIIGTNCYVLEDMLAKSGQQPNVKLVNIRQLILLKRKNK